jgi:hypothetical protein
MDLRICCRQFAAHRIRVEGMSWGRRLVYAGGMALMPLLHVWRLGKNLRRSPVLWRQWARFAPVMLLLYIPASMAEGAGYLFGAGDADQRRLEVEVFARRDMD